MAGELTIVVGSESSLPQASREILRFAGETRLFCIEGEMGAGKTTLVKALCRALGSQGPFSSPTFSIVQSYAAGGELLYHCDLYRLKSAGELLDLGMEELLDNGNYVFVEWPQLLIEVFDPPRILVTIETTGETRTIRLRKEPAD